VRRCCGIGGARISWFAVVVQQVDGFFLGYCWLHRIVLLCVLQCHRLSEGISPPVQRFAGCEFGPVFRAELQVSFHPLGWGGLAGALGQHTAEDFRNIEGCLLCRNIAGHLKLGDSQIERCH